jgi:beta-lactamase regulating signal transducer with metallopeptidase domain
MTHELFVALGRMNLAIAAALVLVLALRPATAWLFGARIRYLLWSLLPAAALASLVPAATRTVVVHTAAVVQQTLAVAPESVSFRPAWPWSDVLILAWLAGVAASLACLAWRQRAFLNRAKRQGPAVIGLIRPRIHLPVDFQARFSPAEQTLILAHERMHLSRQDARTNGLIALTQCAFWFNPAIHVATWLGRQDQEMACDEAVMTRYPGSRRTYAEAMLKTQITPMALPIGCYWPARGSLPLERRIKMLKAPDRGLDRRRAGGLAVALLAGSAGYTAWAAQPARIVAIADAARSEAGALPQSAPALHRSRPTARRIDKPAPAHVAATTVQTEPATEAAPAATLTESSTETAFADRPPATPDIPAAPLAPRDPPVAATQAATAAPPAGDDFQVSLRPYPPEKPAKPAAAPFSFAERHTEVIGLGRAFPSLIVYGDSFQPF